MRIRFSNTDCGTGWIELSELDGEPKQPKLLIIYEYNGAPLALCFYQRARRARSTFAMKEYRGFPQRLQHEVPHWVEDGALFHVRIALEREIDQRQLIDSQLAPKIMESARFYETRQRWHITLFILMPDHLHALLSFQRDKPMKDVISDWKRFHARRNGVIWQEGFFDHRLRDDERGDQLSAKMNYIRNNPVSAGLCAKAEDWPWVIDVFA